MNEYRPRHLKKDVIEEAVIQNNTEADEQYNDRIHEELDELIDGFLKENEETKESVKDTIEFSRISSENEESHKGHRGIILSVGILVFLLVFFAGFSMIHKGNRSIEEPAFSQEINESNPMDPKLRSMWLSNREISEDYIGQIIFDSGLIDLPFVQARDVYKEDGTPYIFYDADGNLVEDLENHTGNDVYLWTSWKTGEYDRYEEGGSVFLDFRNDLSDRNLIIYGHHFARDWDPQGKKQFTPLDFLLSEENYEDNRYLSLILDNEIRRYVVTNVFTIDTEDEYEQQIIRTDMDYDLNGNADPSFFNGFIGYIDKISRYETDEAVEDGDHLLTLITCIEHQPRYRQVVLCRELDRSIYTD
ncbi:MAG: class B sortase [Erysipelotrichaceae bacterium]|nr:class B sortase [Clostridia bacterium]MBQ6217179.1 class B sortase [Erysipelotrichaceae bacterium]